MCTSSSNPTDANAGEGRQWYVVQAQPRKEKLALAHLERQGFSCFLPLVKRPLKKAGKATFALNPFFPGYLFVAFDKDRDRWRSINGTIGVIRLVSFGEQPTALPEGFVEALMGKVGAEDDCPLTADLTAGAPVRIIGGIFDDLTGTLLSSRPQERVIVLLDLLSGPRRVSLPGNQLIRA